MSRVAKNPIPVPAGVQVSLTTDEVHVKGAKGELHLRIHPSVGVVQEDGELRISVKTTENNGDAQAGTIRALLNNMVTGVSTEFVKQLELVGVGYRAQMQGSNLKLTLGFSHDVIFPVPTGIHIEAPTLTEITIRGVSKHLVGQVAANIRSYRPPEPYKGKGIRYKGEVIIKKEGKKQ
jgi:large subunit ribosomal protein L6